MVFIICCASTPENKAVKNAENIDFELDPDLLPEDYGFLWQKINANIIKIDELPANNRISYVPGLYFLEVQYLLSSAAAGGGRWLTQSDIVPLFFNVERGKSYFLDYEISNNNIKFEIIEITDNSIKEIENEKKNLVYKYNELKDFLNFSNENPNYLSGTWYYESKYPYYNNTINFLENKFEITSFNRVAKSTSVTNGKYFFNNEIIVLFFEEKQDKEHFKKEILSYELKNNFLNIIDAPQSTAILTVGTLKGEYQRQK